MGCSSRLVVYGRLLLTCLSLLSLECAGDVRVEIGNMIYGTSTRQDVFVQDDDRYFPDD